MKNELPIMPIRSMYADKSTEGKDLNKVGDIEPVIITDDTFTQEILEKAIEAGAFVYDGKTWFVTNVNRDGGVDMYASATLDDEFTARVLNIYYDNDDTNVTVDEYTREIPHRDTLGIRLYKHELVYMGDTIGRKRLIIVTTFAERFDINTDYTDNRFGLKTSVPNSELKVLRWIYGNYPSDWVAVYSDSYNLKVWITGASPTYLFSYDSTGVFTDTVTPL